jgi:hypothetical protein
VVGEDAGDGFVDLENQIVSEDFLDGEIESSVAGEQRPDTQRRGGSVRAGRPRASLLGR